MENRTIVVLTIVVILALFIIFKQDKSTKNLYVIQNRSEEAIIKSEDNIVKKETYPSSAIWKVGESLKLGDLKKSENGLYMLKVESSMIEGFKMTSLNSYNPKFAKLNNLTNNPQRLSGGGDGVVFTLKNDGIYSKDSNGYSSSGFSTNIYMDKILSIMPNPDAMSYNSYDINGNLLGPIKAPQGTVTMDNYHKYFKDVKTVDHILFTNDSVKAFDINGNLLFVDLI